MKSISVLILNSISQPALSLALFSIWASRHLENDELKGMSVPHVDGDAVIFCAAWNADLSWPVLGGVMKSLPSPSQRSMKSWALALSSSGLSWESISPRWDKAPQVKHLGITPWDNTQAEGSLPWGTELIMGYRERACWGGGRHTMEHLEGNQRWVDEEIKPVWVGSNVQKWRQKIKGICWQFAGWYPSLCFRWWVMLFNPIHLWFM